MQNGDKAEGELQSQRGPDITEAEWRSWFKGKELTEDWLGVNAAVWFKVLAPWREKSLSILEVGAFEGRSVITFLEYMPRCSVVAVDLFPFPEIERRFDRNLASYGNRVTKMKGSAVCVLEELATKGTNAWSETKADLTADATERFDLIYLDAAKSRQDAFIQSALAWPLLKVGGVMIWDDFRWRPERPDHMRPGSGIKLFFDSFSASLIKLFEGYQLIAQKTRQWPSQARVSLPGLPKS